ncbi:DUF3048 domain-containing protein [Candidatus Saccharibacteria bacterium]|nr:DUF3048 domain-containing protein [Candidatus Saccharibacteria bacterium]
MQPDLPLKHSRFERAKAWIHKHPARTYTVIAFGLILAGGMTTTALLWKQPEKSQPVTEKKSIVAQKPKPVYYSPLTGEVVANQAATTKPVTAVMIENSPSARPQSGLKDAEIVYEAVAEGGITRFLTIFQQHQPEVVGPVRSVRMYYVDWLTPYDASVAHVGGSAEALRVVRGGGYRDIDQFFNAQYYRRATDRAAPHNVYTSFSKLTELNTSKGYTASAPKAIERGDDEAAPVQDGTQVQLKISGALYNSTYSYDAETKLYARSQADAPHLDRESGQIQAKVVIALRVNMQRVMEDGYRESITTTGNGDAMVFQNGHATKATWFKDDRAGQLRFNDESGKPLKLARGTTWISAIPLNGGDVTWQ